MNSDLILLMKIGKEIYEYKNNKLEYFKQKEFYKSLGLVYPFMIIFKENFKNKDEQDSLLMLSYDTKERLQYKYSQLRAENSLEEKTTILTNFINSYENLTKNIKKDLMSSDLNIKKILALMCYLLITTGIRIGKDIHYKNYGTIGLSTLKLDNIEFRENKELFISFIGKKGVYHEYLIYKDIVYDIFEELRDLNKNNSKNKEKFLFFLDNKKINYNDLNKYIKDNSLNDNLTSKDFRTLIGNITYLDTVLDLIEETIENDEKINIENIIKESSKITSEILHNTKSVAKKYYVFDIINDYFRNIKDYNDVLKYRDNSIELLKIILNSNKSEMN